MAKLTCPNCNAMTKKGSLKTWVILVAICFFPIGLLALLADGNPTKCYNCDHTWQA